MQRPSPPLVAPKVHRVAVRVPSLTSADSPLPPAAQAYRRVMEL